MDVRLPFIRSRARAAASRGRIPDREELWLVNETSFFRYEHHHRVLADVALPAAARAAAAQGRSLRILSAGCATGEEPYSIAMTIRQNRANLAGCDTEILAVDVSETALDTAAKGVYAPAGVAGVPPAYLGRYFMQGADGLTLVPAVRGMVKFARYDLREGLYLGKFDVVFCCNVLLYFVAEVKQELVRRLATLVRRNGYLFLGHADGPVLPPELFEAADLPSFVHRRR